MEHHPLLGGCLSDLYRVTFQVLPIGHEYHDSLMVLRERIAVEQLARGFQCPGDRRASHGHVVGGQLPKELCNGSAVAGEGETEGFTCEGYGTKACTRQLMDQSRHLCFRPLAAVGRHVARVHALGVIQHDHTIEIGGRDEARAGTILRTR